MHISKLPLSLPIDIDRLWVALIDENLHDEAFKELQERGGTWGLTFTRTAAQVLEKLCSKDKNDMVHTLMPFMQNPEPETLPLLRRWFRKPKKPPIIANHAALLLAEVEGLSVKTLPKLMELLNGDEDRSRHRVARLFHQSANPTTGHTLPVSSLGVELMEELARNHVDYRDKKPFISLTIAWLGHNIIHDDPKAIKHWVEKINNGTENTEAIELILSEIEELTSEVWSVLNTKLKEGTPKLPKILLIFVCQMLHLEKTPKNFDWKSTLLDIKNNENSKEELEQEFVLVEGAKVIIEVAREVLLKDLDSSTPQKIMVQKANALLEAKRTTLANILWNSDLEKEEDLKGKLAAIAENNLYAMKNRQEKIREEIDQTISEIINKERVNPGEIDQTNELTKENILRKLLKLLIEWLVDTVEYPKSDKKAGKKETQDTLLYRKLSFLLEVTEEVIVMIEKQSSSTINFEQSIAALLDTVENVESVLVELVQTHNSYPGRQAAITLLSYRGLITKEVIEALHSGLHGVTFVQKAALASIERFTRLDDKEDDKKDDKKTETLEELCKDLKHNSATIAYATAKLLSTLALRGNLSSTQREKIKTELAKAIDDSNSNRVVHLWHVPAKIPKLPTLKQLFYQELLKIVSSPPKQKESSK